jgi:hypothetical protein
MERAQFSQQTIVSCAGEEASKSVFCQAVQRNNPESLLSLCDKETSDPIAVQVCKDIAPLAMCMAMPAAIPMQSKRMFCMETATMQAMQAMPATQAVQEMQEMMMQPAMPANGMMMQPAMPSNGMLSNGMLSNGMMMQPATPAVPATPATPAAPVPIMQGSAGGYMGRNIKTY